MIINRNIPVEFTVKNTYEVADTRFVEVTIKLMHTNENYNGSFFSKEIVESAIPSLANTPILAYIEENSDGEIDYSDHRQILVKEDGEYKIKYIGQAIGVIPETNNARFEKYTTESNIEREYLVVDGLLWTKWDDPIDIIQRDTKHQQSMEIHQNYQGRFEDDNLFHFTYFQFFGACALSNVDVLPAMEEASIELKFSFEDFKKEIQCKMEQYKNFTIQNQSSTNPEVDINNKINHTTQEGGKELVDKKLELLQKYNLTQENLSFDIDELSLEDLENKINEQFALLASQKQEEISNALRAEKYRDRWGDEMSAYSYVDSTDTEVFAYDRQNNWSLCGFMYSMSGDSIVIDFASKKRKKFQIVDFEEGVSGVEGLFPQEALNYEVSSKERELQEQFAKSNEGVETAEQIAEKFTALESEKQEIKTQLDTISNEYESIKPELTRLQEFEKLTISTQRTQAEEILFSQFDTQLTDNEEYQTLKQNASQFSLEQLEKEVAFIIVKNGVNVKFTSNKGKKQNQTVKLPFSSNHDESGNKPYGSLFEKYLSKED